MSFFKKKPVQEQPAKTERFYDEDEHLGYFKEPCPKCGGKVWYDLSCHTYGGNPDGTGWKACLPCDSAAYLYCKTDGCPWSYTWGHNKNNPRFANEESRRPSWLIGDWLY